MATTAPLPVRHTRTRSAEPTEAAPASAPWTTGDIVHVTGMAVAALLMVLAFVVLTPIAIDWFNEALLV